jgi:hypothetical protein
MNILMKKQRKKKERATDFPYARSTAEHHHAKAAYGLLNCPEQQLCTAHERRLVLALGKKAN